MGTSDTNHFWKRCHFASCTASISVSRPTGGPGLVCCSVTQGDWKQLPNWWSQRKSRSLSQQLSSEVWNPGHGSVHTKGSWGPVSWSTTWYKQLGAVAVVAVMPPAARQVPQTGSSSHSHRGGIILPALSIGTEICWRKCPGDPMKWTETFSTYESKIKAKKSLPNWLWRNSFHAPHLAALALYRKALSIRLIYIYTHL